MLIVGTKGCRGGTKLDLSFTRTVIVSCYTVFLIFVQLNTGKCFPVFDVCVLIEMFNMYRYLNYVLKILFGTKICCRILVLYCSF